MLFEQRACHTGLELAFQNRARESYLEGGPFKGRTLVYHDLAIVCHDLDIVCHDLDIVCHDLDIVCHDLDIVCHDLDIVYSDSSPPLEVTFRFCTIQMVKKTRTAKPFTSWNKPVWRWPRFRTEYRTHQMWQIYIMASGPSINISSTPG